jgi:16S rRNA (cytosine1402-N4)-methyltransferase
MNFAGIGKLVAEDRGGFDCVLADLGVSSMQLDNPVRGFTFKRAGPLDLRLNPGRGQPASTLLQSLTEKELEQLLRVNADEPFAAGIARAIVKSPVAVVTTTALPACLKPGGRAAVLSFHSGEDERVARAFQQGLDSGVYAAMSHEPVRAAPQERYDNPRSKSAILRRVKKASGENGK